MSADQEDIRRRLPWYVNDTLPAKERAEIEAAIAGSETLQAEVRWLRSLRSTLQAEALPASADLGLSKLLARIEGEKTGRVAPLPVKPPRRWERPALAIAATLLLAQAGVIGFMAQHGPQQPDALRPLGAATPGTSTDRTMVQIVFRDTATEAQIRGLLREVGGEIVAGPGALGVYTVRLAATDMKAAIGRLKARTDIIDNLSENPQ